MSEDFLKNPLSLFDIRGKAAIDSRPAPSPCLQKLVADGKLGFKSGEGFRRWTAKEQDALRSKVVQHLKSMQGR